MHSTLQAYVLDTDALSNFLDNRRNYPQLVRRIMQTDAAIPGAARQQHPNDCRIAASAMSRGYTVVTRNTHRFAKIPGVVYEEWMLAETL